MKLVYIISLLALEVVAVAGSCVANAFINTMEIVYPKDNMLVHNPYYTKLSAEIAIEADEFTKMQQDFHICASATIDIGAERVEIYKECGRSVFGQGEVRGKEGVNYLQLSLHHLESKLCEVNVTIHCCADVVSAGAVLEAKKQATLNSFMRTGSEFERKIRDSESQLFERTATTTPLNAKMTSQLNVVIGIKSGAMHSPKRESIRATWLKQLHQVSYDAVSIIPYFLIGNSSTAHANATIERLLKVEQLLYQDVLLTDELPVTDSYLLLGQKVLSFMKWISTHSGVSRIDYVVICDDDVYIDMWQLKEHLMYLQQHMSNADHYYAGEV